MGLYFGVGAPLLGAHTSYHRDGNVFRTSPATQMRPRFSGRQLSLEQFRGWEQFGVAMLLRERVSSLPPVRSRDRRTGNIVCDVPVEAFSSDTLNIVLELVDESSPSSAWKDYNYKSSAHVTGCYPIHPRSMV